jgi:hypothetical protein
MPYYGSRTAEEQHYHDEIVVLVARARYKFYDKTTYTNLNEEKNMSAGSVNGQEQYPDIVAVEDFTAKPKIIAEIETDSLVSENEVQQWEDYASLNLNFYLYVPTSKVTETIDVIDSEGLRDRILGLRRYELINGELQINKIW